MTVFFFALLKKLSGTPVTLVSHRFSLKNYVTKKSHLSSLIQVAMNRAQVCLISSSKSGERHLYLIKVSRDKISDNNDQESANCDAKGNYLHLLCCTKLG